MEFSFKNGNVSVDSEKKEISLLSDSVVLDGVTIECAGEYEKSGFLMYAYHRNDEILYHFRAEGNWIAYIPKILTDITPEALDFLGTVDILVMPTAKASQWVVEKVEPRLLVTYGDSAHELWTILGYIEAPVSKYKLKEADMSSEKTNCVVLG